MSDPSRRRFLLGAGVSLPVGLLSSPMSARPTAASDSAGLPLADPRDVPASDRRLEVRTIDTLVVPRKYSSRREWEARAARLREQILSAAGLWPMPERAPLNAQIFDRIEQDGFTVEKAYFESYPGFFSTGNLYRPRGGKHQPPFPGILCPHGHWNYGRLEHAPDDLNGGSVPQRCMNFALQGYVAFAYDMVGYNDSFQVPHYYGRDENAAWGLSAEGLRLWLWGVSQLGLQLWNGIRALDFITSFPDVDRERIGMTGASGGGTQTFLLTAVDERIKAAAPVNMISHFMQGGCICENAPNLRIDTDNMEIGAIAAPRPLQMVSAAGDWTRDSERIEYPAIASIYELLGARDHVTHNQFLYDHNYNRPSREAVYAFFARCFTTERSWTELKKVEEQGSFQIDPGHLLVFARRTAPANAIDGPKLMAILVEERRKQLAKARPKRPEQIEDYRRQFGPVYRTALMAEWPGADDLRWWRREETGRRPAVRQGLILSRKSAGDRVPALLVQPRGAARAAALFVHPDGAQAALGAAESPSALARAFYQRHFLLLSIDAFGTGEARDVKRQPRAMYFTTYNRTDDMQRVQDILTALAWLEAAWKPERIVVVGQGVAGLWCLLARPFLKNGCAVAADAAGFDHTKDESYLEKLNIPLLRRAGDFQTAALLADPAPLLLHNLGGRFAAEPFLHAFALRDAGSRLRVSNEEMSSAEVAAWAGSV
jgi:dienelactone hydrolase